MTTPDLDLYAWLIILIFVFVTALLASWAGYALGARRLASTCQINDDYGSAHSELSSRISSLELRIERLESQTGSEAAAYESDEPVYVEASRMLLEGSDVAEVASRLGISQAEADLIKTIGRRA